MCGRQVALRETCDYLKAWFTSGGEWWQGRLLEHLGQRGEEDSGFVTSQQIREESITYFFHGETQINQIKEIITTTALSFQHLLS